MISSRKERLYGVFLVLMASMCWGTTGTLQALAPEGAPPLTVGSIRITLSALILLPWCVWRDGGIGFLRRTSLPALMVGVAGLVGFQFSFFTALKLTGVSIGTMIAIGASPMFAGAPGSLVQREPLSARWFVSRWSPFLAARCWSPRRLLRPDAAQSAGNFASPPRSLR